MRFDWTTLVLQTINFSILVWLLHRFLYRPVLAVIAARKADIERQYDRARTIREEGDARLAALEHERAGIGAERTAALDAAGADIERRARAQRERAESEARALLESARRDLAREREEALAEARNLALDLGVEFARKLLSQVPAEIRAEAWLEHLERCLDAMPGPEREALVGAPGGNRAVRIVTASPLPPASEQAWRARLAACWNIPVEMAFEAEPRLIAGVELHFAGALLSFSWRSLLATARAEICGGDAR